MTTQEAFFRPEPERDRWGRYKLADPETGEVKGFTRATTFADAMEDKTGLNKWHMRMAAHGLALRHDLYARVAATSPEDKGNLDKLVKEAQEAAASSTGANIGTALHAFTEQVDVGQAPHVPDPWDKDVAAYRDMLKAAGVRILPEYVERIICLPGLGVAGTLDRIVEVDGQLFIADLKTGRDLSYGWVKIAIQLALYANATHLLRVDGTGWDPMPEVNKDRALVFHLPAGKANCSVHGVNIRAGWEMAQVCGTIRDWRKRKDLATPYRPGMYRPPSDEADAIAKLETAFGPGVTTEAEAPGQPSAPSEAPAVPPTPAAGADEGGPTHATKAALHYRRVDWVKDRIRALGQIPEGKRRLGTRWPEGVPFPAAADTWTVDHVDALAAVLTSVEADVGAPFPDESDPAIVAQRPTETWVTRDTGLRNDANGPTMTDELDGPRIAKQLADVRQAVGDGMWWTLAELAEVVGAPEASISARLRDLRKPQFGGHTVNRQRRGGPTGAQWEYQFQYGAEEPF